MSVNKYNHTSGELTTLANGSRCWIGTKAAYDAEKQAGTLPVNCLIAITDDSEDNNYSTDEKITGKFWIDGKPIYRKVYTDSFNTAQSYAYISFPSTNNIISMSGVASFDTYARFPIGCVDGPKNGISAWYNGNTQNIHIEVWKLGTQTALMYDYLLIVEYTKTTD